MSQDPNQNPYQTPPPQDPNQNPYSSMPPVPGPYGVPPYGTAPGYGYNVPPVGPLPLGEALRQLPQQYMRVLTNPSPLTFAQEMGKASWDIVWVQLLIEAVLSALIGYLGILITPNRFSSLMTPGAPPMDPGILQAVNLGGSLGSIILVPLGFFLIMGIFYLLAKAFGGTGTFLAQCYTLLLIGVPMGIISGLVLLVPLLGALLILAVAVYQIVLEIFAFMAVHRLSGGKASAVVLIPIGAIFLLVICGVVVLVAVIAASLPR